jgi:omega-6 fatty acid desaturase (delta-12 desaturase)
MWTSIVPFFLLWYAGYKFLNVSYLLTLVCCFFAGLFAFRTFIILHDCGHGSFFKNQKWNDTVGVLTGFITYTPYFAWRHSHAIHHATSGDLDRRGVGDVWTMTYEEYLTNPLWKRALYRLYRNPFVIFFIGPPIDFIILQRLPTVNVSDKAREKYSVVYTNLALLGILLGMGFTIGFKEYFLVEFPVIWFASCFGVFMFYVQHQYENVYWERHEDWDYAKSALYGSSYFKLPPVLQWFTGNIGFHHVHHLAPKIPNYNLQACHEQNEVFDDVVPMTIRSSFKSLRIRLYDEDRHKMIGYHRENEPTAEADDEPTTGNILPKMGGEPSLT